MPFLAGWAGPLLSLSAGRLLARPGAYRAARAAVAARAEEFVCCQCWIRQRLRTRAVREVTGRWFRRWFIRIDSETGPPPPAQAQVPTLTDTDETRLTATGACYFYPIHLAAPIAGRVDLVPPGRRKPISVHRFRRGPAKISSRSRQGCGGSVTGAAVAPAPGLPPVQSLSNRRRKTPSTSPFGGSSSSRRPLGGKDDVDECCWEKGRCTRPLLFQNGPDGVASRRGRRVALAF